MNVSPKSNFEPEQKTLLPDPSLDNYKAWLITHGATPNTVRAYRSRVKQFLLFLKYEGVAEQEMLTESKAFLEAVELYRNFLKQSDISARSVNAAMIALNSFSRFLGLEYRSIEREPSRIRTGRYLSPDEKQRFLKSVERQASSRDRALALLLFHTGIKLGDCALLNVADVSFVQETNEAFSLANTGEATGPLASAELIKDFASELYASGTSRIDEHAQFYGNLCLKSGSNVPFNRTVALALKQWLVERERSMIDKAEPGLWINAQGKRLSIAGIDFVIRRIGWQARLVLSCQVLRRTCLSEAARSASKTRQAERFGEYISPTTMSRFGVGAPSEYG